MSGLPAGFELDAPPEGFEIDAPGGSFKELDGVEVPLPRENERAAYEAWLQRNDIREPDHPDQHYDYLGAFRAGIDRDKESAHFPDTFKLPGHESFSDESKYAKDAPTMAGSWDGDRYQPYGPPYDEEATGRARGTLAQRASNALRRWKAGGALQPDDLDALMQALKGNFPREPVGALEAANLHGGNAAVLGHGDEAAGLLGGNKQAIRQRLTDAREQQPAASIAGDVLGGLPTMLAAPGGWLGSAATGAAAGAGNADDGDKGMGALVGAGLGVGSKAVGEYAPWLAKQALGRGKVGAGKAMQWPEQLRRWLAGEAKAAPAAEAAAAPAAAAGPEVASLEEQLADAAAANPMRPTAPSPGMAQEPLGPQTPQDHAIDFVREQAARNDPTNALLHGRHEPNVDLDSAALQKIMRDAQAVTSEAPTKTIARGELMKETKKLVPGVDDVSTNVAKRPEVIGASQIVPRPPPTPVGSEQLGVTPGAQPMRGAAAWEQPTGVGYQKPYQRKAAQEMDLARERQGWDIDSRSGLPPPPPPPPGGGGMPAIDEAALQKLAGQEPAPGPVSTPLSADMAAKKQRIIDAQKANPDALAAFMGDPKAGERGSIDMKTMLALAGLAPLALQNPAAAASSAAGYVGLKGAQAFSKTAPAKAIGAGIGKVGDMLGNSGRAGLTPEAMATSMVSNPSVLLQVARRKDAVGEAARGVLQALQEGGQTALKTRAMALGMMPEFRALFAQGKDGQGQPGATATTP